MRRKTQIPDAERPGSALPRWSVGSRRSVAGRRRVPATVRRGIDQGGPNMEKSQVVDQKATERFERVRSYLVARPALFAAQGVVVATSRRYRGRRLGPYFQLAWREAGRQRRFYLGRSLELVDRVRKLLDQLQQPHRRRRLFARLKRQARSALRRWMAEIRPQMAQWGIQLKGFEFRGTRRALRRYTHAFGPYDFREPPATCILGTLRPAPARSAVKCRT